MLGLYKLVCHLVSDLDHIGDYQDRLHLYAVQQNHRWKNTKRSNSAILMWICLPVLFLVGIVWRWINQLLFLIITYRTINHIVNLYYQTDNCPEEEGWGAIDWFNPVSSQDPVFPSLYVMVFFYCVQYFEVRDSYFLFVDIHGIVDNQCLNFLLICKD